MPNLGEVCLHFENTLVPNALQRGLPNAIGGVVPLRLILKQMG